MHFDWQPYREHFTRTLAEAPAEVRVELERLGMAPFASDPVTTLRRPAELMVVSMKPYGAPGQSYPCGWEERAGRPGLHRWYDGGRAGSNFVQEADVLLREVLRVMQLKLSPREVFNTYAYAYRAADAKQLKGFGLTRVDTSDFHRHYLTSVQPRVILCIGNGPAPSAFALYRDLLGGEVVTVQVAARLLIRYFTSPGGVRVIGVPHLSYVRAESLLLPIRRLIG